MIISRIWGIIKKEYCRHDAIDEPLVAVSFKDVFDLIEKNIDVLPREKIVRFACDCALLNIELIKPYTDKYEMIRGFLIKPVDSIDYKNASASAHSSKVAHCAVNHSEFLAADSACQASFAAYFHIVGEKSYTSGNMVGDVACAADSAARISKRSAMLVEGLLAKLLSTGETK